MVVLFISFISFNFSSINPFIISIINQFKFGPFRPTYWNYIFRSRFFICNCFRKNYLGNDWNLFF